MAVSADVEFARAAARKFRGTRICVTGAVPGLSRTAIARAFNQVGAKLVARATSSTNAVVAGKCPGRQLRKAQLNNIPIVTLEQFMETWENVFVPLGNPYPSPDDRSDEQ